MKILVILLHIMTLANGLTHMKSDPEPACVELIQASKEGNISVVKTLLIKGCDANIINGNDVIISVVGITDHNWTPLIEATFNGHRDVVQVLLSQPNIDVNMKSDQGFTALHAAAFQGYTIIAKDLLAGGANVNSVNHHFNWTPLEAASFAGKSDVVEILLQQPNIDIEIKTITGYTSLITAASKGHVQVVKALLAAGANVSEVTSPHLQLEGRENLEKIVNTLRAAGADISEYLSQLYDPSCFELIQASKEGNISSVKDLLSKGCDVNIINGKVVHVLDITDYNWTPLIEAAFNGHRDMVQVLLSQPNIDVDMKSDVGFTALHAAAFKGYPNMVMDLLAEGANVNSVDYYFNYTPLFLASLAGKDDVVEVLLKQPNIDIETKTSTGYTSLIEAAGRGHVEVVKALLTAGADVSEVTSTTRVTDWEYFKTIVITLQVAGADVAKYLIL